MKFIRSTGIGVYRIVLILLLVSACLNAYLLYQHKKDIREFAESVLQGQELWGTKVSAGDNTPFAYYAFLDQVELVPGTSIQDRAFELPKSLIIQPGTYLFYGSAYELRKEGLYRFIFPEKENQQRIVYSGNLDALMSGVAWIFSHGNSDDGKSVSELNSKSLTSKIFSTCGAISFWIQHVLDSNGIKSRVVSGITLERWNTYDNGHTMIEVYREDYKKWVAYDLDHNVYFTHKGRPLSFIEFANYVQSDDYEFKYLASDSNVDISDFINRYGKYNYAFLTEYLFANERSLRQWYKRVIQVPMIREGNDYYFFDSTNRVRVASYSNNYRYFDRQQFMEKFYQETFCCG